MTSCPRCQATATNTHELTRGKAIELMRAFASDVRVMRGGDQGISKQDAEDVAKESILMRRPTVYASCCECNFEWFIEGRMS
jgi:hypothetical protein